MIYVNGKPFAPSADPSAAPMNLRRTSRAVFFGLARLATDLGDCLDWTRMDSARAILSSRITGRVFGEARFSHLGTERERTTYAINLDRPDFGPELDAMPPAPGLAAIRDAYRRFSSAV